MSKRLFIILISVMLIALMGIITVQIFWIRTAVEMREKEFSTSVKYALSKVSENIQRREFRKNVNEFSSVLDTVHKLKETGVKDFFYERIDTSRNEKFTFRQSILENNYRIQTSPFETDSIDFKTILSKQDSRVEITEFKSKDFSELSPKEQILKIERLDKYDKLMYERVFESINSRKPIHDRISRNELQLSIDNLLRARNIDTKFEYAVYNEDLITKVKSKNFKQLERSTYITPLFLDNEGNSDYQLYVSFPNKKEYILSNITEKLVLSAFFIFAIILVFASTLYQLLKQKQISAIKTDFINNMTHEFKTPIATINLAIDSIKNPKIIGDKEKVIRYVEMIRQENKRMHAQVENVLRISKLEKNQLDVSNEVVEIHEIIDNAISHVELLVSNRDGYIKRHFEANLDEVLANGFHLTNIIVNVLDNAIKYSEESPKIDIYTENAGNNILIKVKDQGIGMNKNVQKKVFDKFYREHGGNIHNVKGHGLGLAYVKRITEMLHGSVYVESEKDKGSMFIIKLPLI